MRRKDFEPTLFQTRLCVESSPSHVRCVLHTEVAKAPVQSQQVVGEEKLMETT